MRRHPWFPALIDLVLIVVFAAIGMSSHEETVSAATLANVAWPFVVGAAIGGLVSLAWRNPAAPLRTGIPVWILAAGGGMILRVATGGGFAVAFLVVTLIVLAIFLVGWRAIAALVVALRKKRAA
jgi:hypothetical protein